jgi:predicted dehydrogenase
MLDRAKPDVVHITTSPESHYDLARLCFEYGANVYVEKPFTVDAEQARILLDLAEEKGLRLTVGHNEQFSPAARRLRALVAGGYLGEIPIHMECHHCYSLDDPNYARALLGDKQHWVRRLPGKLLQNIISHGIARIAEFMTSDCPLVIAHGFVSPLLKSIHETDIIDELRVILAEDERTTAYFSFSTQMRPAIHEFRIFGSKNGLMLDQDHDIVLKLRGSKYKSYADKFVPSIDFAKQHLGNLFEQPISHGCGHGSSYQDLPPRNYGERRSAYPVPRNIADSQNYGQHFSAVAGWRSPAGSFVKPGTACPIMTTLLLAPSVRQEN